MAIATIDTLKLSKTLKATGLPDNQAEALASAFAEMVQVNFKELATKDEVERLATMIDQLAKSFKDELERVAKASKADLDRVDIALRGELERFAKEIRSELEQTKMELKRDIADLRTEFTSEIKLLKTELKSEMQSLHAKNQAEIMLLRWMMRATFTGVLATVGMLIRLLFFPVK